MSNPIRTYTVKSNAARDAAKQGLSRADVYRTPDGLYAIDKLEAAYQRGEEWAVEAKTSKATPAPVAPAKADAIPAYKTFQLYGQSCVLKPVAVVHSFLAERGADLSRKEALFELSKMGVNRHTARTQYQVWLGRRGK